MARIPDPVRTWLAENSFGEVVGQRAASGGCINQGRHLETQAGRRFFLKTNPAAPAQMFEREAEGLAALAVPGGPRLPAVLLVGDDFLLLEDLQPARARPDYWERFGAALANLHLQTSPCFGFAHDNYIGSTPQPNPWVEDGFSFFAEHRLLFQARLAQRQGLLSLADLKAAERLAARLPDLIPMQPASLLHGDLWSGNAITDEQGCPAVIDPAAYFGWAEAELAMTTLFGAFPERFYQAYVQQRPLAPGYRQRFAIYNLYHLLNHLNLFGSGYYPEVSAILGRF